MPRAVKTLAVIVLIALIPLRAVASATIGYCAMAGHHEAVKAAASSASDSGPVHHAGHDPASEHSGDAPGAEPSSSPTCPEHSAGGAFVASPDRALAVAFAEARVSVTHSAVPAFVPPLLERPPLA